MGEARRRREKDTNFGKPNIIKSAIKFTNRMLRQCKRTDQFPVICFTNNNQGCNDQDILLLKDKIPQIFASEELIFFALPEDKVDVFIREQDANIDTKKLIRNFVQIFVCQYDDSVNEAELNQILEGSAS